MELFSEFFDILIHFDQHLIALIDAYGKIIYILLFLIIFAETGLLIFPFLPGDSLLFILGTLCSKDILNLPLILISLTIAAILGDSLNFHLGYYFQKRIIRFLKKIKLFNEKSYRMAELFYDKHGAMAIISVRFLPILRTFVPFVAGVAKMQRGKFTLYNVIGAHLWIIGITLIGFFFGFLPIPWLQDPEHLWIIFLSFILIPGFFALIGIFRFWRQQSH